MRLAPFLVVLAACGRAPRPASPVPAPVVEPRRPPPAVVVTSDAELTALGHTAASPVDFSRVALVVVAGLGEPTVIAEVGVTIDRRSGEPVDDPDARFVTRDLLSVRIDADAIVIDELRALVRPCPPAMITVEPKLDLRMVGAMQRTIAFAIPIESASLPVRYERRTVDDSLPCPILSASRA